MSGALRKVAIIAGVVALAATGAGAFASAGLLGVGVTGVGVVGIGSSVAIASVATAVSVAASIGAQLTAKKPTQQFVGSVNSITIGANQPIPYSMGRSFVAGAQMHDVGYGGRVSKVDNPYLSRVWIWSASTCQAIEDFLVDWQSVGTTGSGGSGYYAGWLTIDTQLGLRPEPAALSGPYGAIPDWGSDHKLSGCAAGLLTLRFDKDGKVWSNGVPAMGVVGQWAKVYDRRQDGTAPGGLGLHRFGDEETFVHDPNAGLNAATYARGRFALDADGNQSVMIVGCGFPEDSFDWPAWNAWASVCEVNGWEANGTVYDGPGISRWDNLKKICAAGAAEPCFSGGKLSVRFQSPKVAIDTITADDLAPGEYVAPGMRTYRDRVKTVVPKYRSEANKWEMVQSAAVSLDGTPSDGFDEEEITYELITIADQAAVMGAYDLFGRYEITGITLPCKPRLWEYRLGEALNVDIPELGIDHLCVITAISKDISQGVVTLTLDTETTAKHPFALGQTGTAPPPPTLIPHGDADDAAYNNDNPDPAPEWAATATIVNGSNTTTTGTGPYTATKSGGTNGSFDASAVSGAGYTGNAVARIEIVAATGQVVAGLATNPASGYAAIEYGFYLNGASGSGPFAIIESGSLVSGVSGTFAIGDVFWVVQGADGGISYWRGATLAGASLLHATTAALATLWFDSSLAETGCAFKSALYQRN